jgi:hypothetical protein
MIVCNWGFCSKELISLGYDDIGNDDFESNKDLWSTAKELVDSGLNIMLCHSKDGISIFVDNKMFSQR